VTLKAMAKRPEDRYQTALEMRQDLERARTGQPVSVGVPLASQTTQALGAAGIADNPTTVLGANSTMAGDRSMGYGEELPGKRRSSAGWVVAAILALLVVGFAAFLITRSLTSSTGTSQTGLSTTEAPTTTAAPTTSGPTTTEQSTTSSQRTTTSTTERSTTSTTERSTTTSSTQQTTSTSAAATTLTSKPSSTL
jgi:eukaryotic-like serine/threonine-protein kinase